MSAPDVVLAAVDDDVLDAMVQAAVTDALPDEVTPPIGEPVWSAARIDWLRSLHRDCRAGLDGPTQQATWAIVAGGQVVGQIRLKRLDGSRLDGSGRDESPAVETGMWLTRSARGRGVGTRALELVVAQARAAGAHTLRADTTKANVAAQGALRRLGFTLTDRGDGVTIDAALDLDT